MGLGEKTITAELAQLVLPSVNHEQTITVIEQLVKKNTATAFAALSAIITDSRDIVAIADDMIDILRQLMILQVTSLIPASKSSDTHKQLQALASQITSKNLMALIDILTRRRLEIKSSPFPQLPLEMTIIEWCDEAITVDASKEKQAPPTATKAFSLKDAEKIWKDFLSAVEAKSPSLVFILKMAELISVSGQTLTLNVPYTFHRDKLIDLKNRDLLQKTLSDLLATTVILEVTAIGSTEEKKNELNDLASLVGGEIV
jgi:DNA polymerase-3 subunit gamma/tau